MTIGERDLEFYRMCVENHNTAIRRCAPIDEERFRTYRDAAQAVVNALEAYNAVQMVKRLSPKES